MHRRRLRLKCDGTRAETRFRLSAKRTSPFKSARYSVQSTTGSRGVRISGSNVGYTMFRGSLNSTGYPLHSPVSPSLPLPCVIVCHHVPTGVYLLMLDVRLLVRRNREPCGRSVAGSLLRRIGFVTKPRRMSYLVSESSCIQAFWFSPAAPSPSSRAVYGVCLRLLAI